MAGKSTRSPAAADTPKPGGKGRPTPKRGAQQARARTPAPKTRKEAIKRERQEVKEVRRAQKAGLRSGDERLLPAFARGPERAAIRDAIDSRMSLGWLALPGLALNLASFAVPRDSGGSLLASLGFAAFMMLLIDTFAAVRRVGRLLRLRFPDGHELSRGAVMRATIARNTQLRRTRIPPPRVKVGEDVFGATKQEK